MSQPKRWWRWGRSEPDPNPAASMALLQEVLDRPLDPGYVSAAQARVARGERASTGSRTPLVVSTSVLIGFLMTVAAVQLRAPDPAAAQARAEVIERIEQARDLGDSRAEHIEELRAEVSDLEQRALQGNGGSPTAGQDLALSAVAAGSSPMVGTGLAITLDDPVVRPGEETSDADARVLAYDMQILVNGLWSAGAEAIAINDLRLTSTSSIRHAGEAIVVDFRGLTRPYLISVIGPQDALITELRTGRTGTYFNELVSRYHMVLQWSENDETSVPAGSRVSTRLAEVVEPETEGQTADGEPDGDDPSDGVSDDPSDVEEGGSR